MRPPKPWWQLTRIKHRDAIALCVLSAALLLAGELAVGILREIYAQYLEPVQSDPALFLFRAILAAFAFTTAFGAVLVLLGGWYFMQGKVGRGRFLVGLGVGLTSLLLVSRIAYATLVFGTPMAYLIPLATSLTGVGLLAGAVAHTLMGQYALLAKKRMAVVWRRWRRARGPRRRGARRGRSARFG